ncbi:molybdenum cofactor guanylyltransferase [Paenibacillus roseipurpureus]|uniref:Probable molybdenum cofactor guanylyltransferase n=1 Tax=Paenibacillus roseopurpureus TaxID=2918901 RepID=A0AA96RL88_9BACL|nr:molybdenum cofactor guanylyltransferase [Paenibacillus sp. MBLB1832]WNR45515.1 molybdenum cofactor guanylyltransferase [Paenibacillus sp. MBLB1832]
MTRMPITGVILAGGLNRRMEGRAKALLTVQGEALIVRQLKEMSAVCGQLIVVTNEAEALQTMIGQSLDMNVTYVTDVYRQNGPLSGIHAAALAATMPHLWIVGCDMPLISSEAAAAMVSLCRDENVDAVIPEIDGRLHPLHGIYAREVGPEAELHLQKESYKLMKLLDHLDWLPVRNDFFKQRQLRTNFVVNVNTPQDFADMLTNLSSFTDF